MTLPRGWELILVVIVIVLLFGAKRMPDAARGLGRSLRIFKAETKGLTDGESDDTKISAEQVDDDVIDVDADSPQPRRDDTTS